MDQEGIGRAAQIVRGARSVVALTGAGISVPSGIPDFRSDEGLWRRDDPMEVASLRAFHADPRRFYDWFRPLLDRLLAAQPNPAHTALAILEQAGLLKAVITQNIDGLHQRAGSREVYELHGHLRSATCLGCERQVPATPLLAPIRRGETPRCECGGPFKPDVVLFDEMLPRGLFWLAQRALETCDAIIIAGTALEVAPVCEMPQVALRRGARLIIVNQSETHLDKRADVVLREDVAVALPAIVENVKRTTKGEA
jgi:NAD-dependent deacetylase